MNLRWDIIGFPEVEVARIIAFIGLSHKQKNAMHRLFINLTTAMVYKGYKDFEKIGQIEDRIKDLISDCRKLGIAGWRIYLLQKVC